MGTEPGSATHMLTCHGHGGWPQGHRGRPPGIVRWVTSCCRTPAAGFRCPSRPAPREKVLSASRRLHSFKYHCLPTLYGDQGNGISNFLKISSSPRLAKFDLWRHSHVSIFADFCEAPIDKAPRPVCQSQLAADGEAEVSHLCLEGNGHPGWQGHVVPQHNLAYRRRAAWPRPASQICSNPSRSRLPMRKSFQRQCEHG